MHIQLSEKFIVDPNFILFLKKLYYIVLMCYFQYCKSCSNRSHQTSVYAVSAKSREDIGNENDNLYINIFDKIRKEN